MGLDGQGEQMMLSMIEWNTFWIGLVAGAFASSLFFAGLAMGMRLALQSDKPAALLFISAAVRIALLLWFGSWVASRGSGALIGFALAFLMMRLIITALVRPTVKPEPAPWN